MRVLGAKAGVAVEEYGVCPWASSKSVTNRPVSFRLPTARNSLEQF